MKKQEEVFWLVQGADDTIYNVQVPQEVQDNPKSHFNSPEGREFRKKCEQFVTTLRSK